MDYSANSAAPTSASNKSASQSTMSKVTNSVLAAEGIGSAVLGVASWLRARDIKTKVLTFKTITKEEE